MHKFIQLILNDPCNEDWTKMAPKGCGRFCAACEKTVVDFSEMSNEDFIAFFQQTKSVPCGRYTEEQLELKIPVTDTMHADLVHNSLPKVIKFGALSPIPVSLPVFKMDTQYKRTPQPAIRYPNVATGRVTDSSGNALPGTIIRIKNTAVKTIADHSGYFSIMLQKAHHTILCLTRNTIAKEVKIHDLGRPLLISLPVPI